MQWAASAFSPCIEALSANLLPWLKHSNVAAGQKVERPVFAAVGRLELVSEPELPLVLQLQANDGLTQRVSVLTDHTQSRTFQEVEILEESRDDEGVTKIQEQPAEDQALGVQVGGVWTRIDVTHRNLWADVQVAVDGQDGVVPVLDGHREQSVAAALEKLLEEELCWSIQQRLLTVRGTHVLGRADQSQVLHLHEFRFDQEVLVPSDWNVLLHEAEVVEATEQQTTAVHSQIKVHLLAAVSVEVILNVLCQVDIEQHKVMEVASTEGPVGSAVRQPATPLTRPTQGIKRDLRGALHVLQH